MDKAKAHGLKFRYPLDIDEGAALGEVEDSFKAFLNGTYALLHAEQRHWRMIDRPPEVRSMTVVHTINETIDASVFDRCRAQAYAPPNLVDWAARHGVVLTELHGSRLAADPKSKCRID